MEKKISQKNVLGESLEKCSLNPLTGWYRDGCCNTDENDNGVHTVCAKVTNEFLEWCKEAGNDLITHLINAEQNGSKMLYIFSAVSVCTAVLKLNISGRKSKIPKPNFLTLPT